MPVRPGAFAIFLTLLSFCLPAFLRGQEPVSSNEIPIERCDLLPVVKVRIDGTDMRFLLDTGATTMLNLKSFSSGRSKKIQVTSWSGTAATSAREVSLPELALGNHRLQGLKLPAIDLSPIGKACGGQIDGILGVDLLDKMGVTIDLKRQVASPGAPPEDAKSLYEKMESAMHHCNVAFEAGLFAELEECFDPEIVLYTPQGEFIGREKAMKYLQERYLKFAPELHYNMSVHEVKMFGDALWYSYDYWMDSPREHIAGHGMSMCRKDNGHWRILNLHNSLLESPLQAGASARKEN
jgi:Aspartyl protease/SnoaL-like domain